MLKYLLNVFYTYKIFAGVLGLHFHLAGTINAATDIPLVPSMATPSTLNVGDSNGGAEKDGDQRGHRFVIHWIDGVSGGVRILDRGISRVFGPQTSPLPSIAICMLDIQIFYILSF